MSPEDKAWQKLIASARLARDDRNTTAPYGFATRVAARAMAEPRFSPGLIERFSWRAVIAALLLALGGVATNYASWIPAANDDEPLIDESAITSVYDIS